MDNQHQVQEDPESQGSRSGQGSEDDVNPLQRPEVEDAVMGDHRHQPPGGEHAHLEPEDGQDCQHRIRGGQMLDLGERLSCLARAQGYQQDLNHQGAQQQENQGDLQKGRMQRRHISSIDA